MAVSILIFIRNLDMEGRGGQNLSYLIVVSLMLTAGALKHNVLSTPISIGIYLMLYDRPAFIRFSAWSVAGLTAISTAAYVLYGGSIFSSLLFPREYSLSAAWDQTTGQLRLYNVFLLVIPYLAFYPNRKAKLLLIAAIVSLIQGFVLSGGTDVDVSVFFDFVIFISIGLSLVESSISMMINDNPGKARSSSLLASWLFLSSMPLILSLRSGVNEARLAFNAVTDNLQQVDLDYVKAAKGRVVCENLAFCYWAGKDFEVDLNNLKTMAWAMPNLEEEFLARIETCSYALIQLDDDWEDSEGPLTVRMIETLKRHYAEAKETGSAVYWLPSKCSNQGRNARKTFQAELLR
jgi:hypothetical protein